MSNPIHRRPIAVPSLTGPVALESLHLYSYVSRADRYRATRGRNRALESCASVLRLEESNGATAQHCIRSGCHARHTVGFIAYLHARQMHLLGARGRSACGRICTGCTGTLRDTGSRTLRLSHLFSRRVHDVPYLCLQRPQAKSTADSDARRWMDDQKSGFSAILSSYLCAFPAAPRKIPVSGAPGRMSPAASKRAPSQEVGG